MSSFRIRKILSGAALLNWQDKDLAERAGITKQTMSKMRRGQLPETSPSIDKAERALRDHGIRLTAYGAELPPSQETTYEGQSGFQAFLRDVMLTVETAGGDICVSNVDESLFIHWTGNYADEYLRHMRAHKDKFHFRIIVKEGDSNMPVSDYATYRRAAREDFGAVPVYIYGDNKAEIWFNGTDYVKIAVSRGKAFADQARKEFERKWDAAR